MGHTFSKLIYHCMFSTKERRRLIAPEWRKRLHGYIGGILGQSNAKPLGVGGTEDHVHLLIELDGKTPIADMMRIVKANTSKWVHETFPDAASFAWQTGYAAFTVSSSAVAKVARYIEDQKVHHRQRSFEEELAAFLQRHGLQGDDGLAAG